MAETNKTESSARITNLLSGLVARLHSTPLRNFAEQLIGIFPADGSHEGVNISRCFCTEVDVIGVLVHVERKNRHATCERMAVVRCPLIDELPIRGDQDSKTQPEPPASALPMATNSECQRSYEPKSRASASRKTGPGSLCSPSPSKNNSCRIIEFIAMSCSRLRPLMR